MGVVVEIGALRPHVFQSAACPYCRTRVSHVYPASCKLLECGGCGDMVPVGLWDITGWHLFYSSESLDRGIPAIKKSKAREGRILANGEFLISEERWKEFSDVERSWIMYDTFIQHRKACESRFCRLERRKWWDKTIAIVSGAVAAAMTVLGMGNIGK